MIEKNNQHPYIIAYGTSRKDILSFYIAVECHLISVSLIQISMPAEYLAVNNET